MLPWGLWVNILSMIPREQLEDGRSLLATPLGSDISVCTTAPYSRDYLEWRRDGHGFCLGCKAIVCVCGLNLQKSGWQEHLQLTVLTI